MGPTRRFARSLPPALALLLLLAVAAPARAAANRLANPEFDTGLSGWRVDFPQVHYSGADSGFSPDSGSMQIDHPAPQSGLAFTGRQCVAIEPGALYEGAVRAALLGPDHPRGAVFLEIAWHAAADCAGEPLEIVRLAESDERYWFWLILTGEAAAPAGAAAAEFRLGLEKLEAGEWTLQSLFDRAFFGPLGESAEAGGELVVNGQFDAGIAGWEHDEDVVFSGDDASGNPASGSLEIRNDEDDPIGDEDAHQCFAIAPGTYDFAARYRLLGETPVGTANVELRLFSAPGCPDGAVVDNRVLAVGTAREVWTPLQAVDVVVPEGVASARLKLETIKTGAGTLTGRYDQVSFAPASSGGGACVPAPGILCLRGGRFRATADWVTGLGTSGPGFAVALTDDTGYFWFFDPANVETVVKVLDGCPVNERFWVYAGGLTDLGVMLTVTDTLRGAVATYQNTLGRPFETIADVDALDACP